MRRRRGKQPVDGHSGFRGSDSQLPRFIVTGSKPKERAFFIIALVTDSRESLAHPRGDTS